ncbi:MAG: L-2-hydroxyglutarate oxidase [Balneolaceae bacterium]
MTYDFLIVGAGIVGLSTAYKLSESWPEANILVLEKEDRVAAHQTGNNSGVIHSGIYYKPGSYKARNCVDGRLQLTDFCQQHGIKHDICGKVIVATDEEELSSLEEIYRRGQENEIEGIRLINSDELNEIEPHCSGLKAIHVPCAGIVDFPGVCRQLRAELEKAGGKIIFDAPVRRIAQENDSLTVSAGKETYKTRFLINCAGLYSDHVSKSAGVTSPVKIVPFRGEYYELVPEAENLVRGLIYPVPGNSAFPFLGVHFTRMATGGVECGPNAVFAFKREGYKKFSFDLDETIETLNFPGFWKMAGKHWRMGLDEWYRSVSKKGFLKNLQKLIPEVQSDDLKATTSGVRAMALLPSGEILDDFYFLNTERSIHVLNAPSPAATAGLAIGDEIVFRAETFFQL